VGQFRRAPKKEPMPGTAMVLEAKYNQLGNRFRFLRNDVLLSHEAVSND
jgi:hypothetical protein